MNIPPQNYRCPLGKYFPNSRPDAETIKRQGWQENQILVISPDDPRLDGFERELIKQLGNRLYGSSASRTLRH